MKFTLFKSKTQPNAHFWQLDIGGELLYESKIFDNFIAALRDAENCRLSLADVPVTDENGNSLHRPTQENFPESPLLFRVIPTDNQNWLWEICSREGDRLMVSSPFDKKEKAVDFVSAIASEIYSDAEIVDQHNSHLPYFSFSHHYRETFGIVDDHPSAQRPR
ncbi:hypothetical protein [Pectobacterium cacticida]|uniref:hypothetical protein n=1 Tax=Pectobacterium cacticida TaxID=69221 RepID=UPI003985D70B